MIFTNTAKVSSSGICNKLPQSASTTFLRELKRVKRLVPWLPQTTLVFFYHLSSPHWLLQGDEGIIYFILWDKKISFVTVSWSSLLSCLSYPILVFAGKMNVTARCMLLLLRRNIFLSHSLKDNIWVVICHEADVIHT